MTTSYSGLWRKILFICLLGAAVTPLTAAPWDADPNFGNNGIYTFPTGSSNSTVRSMVVLPDDRIVLAGYSSSGDLRSNRFPTLERLLPNGMSDPSFGAGGAVVFPFAGEFESLVVQADGKLLMAGMVFVHGDAGSMYLVVRCNADGTLDTAFNGTGKITGTYERRAKFGYGDEVLLRPDGRIVVAGSSKAGAETFGVAQFNANGSLDTSFGASGKILVPGTRHLESAFLQPDGKIVLAGTSNFTLVRLLPAGALDPSFGSGGIIVHVFNVECEVKTIKLQPIGNFVAAGWCGGVNDHVSDYLIARFNQEGTFDVLFSTIKRHRDPDHLDGGLVVQPDGRIFYVSVIGFGGGNRFVIDRYQNRGENDFSWRRGNGLPLPASILKGEVVAGLQKGRLILAGGTTSASHVAVRLGSYERNATPLFDFDGDGKTDISLYRSEAVTNWLLQRSSAGVIYVDWGNLTDIPVPGDYDGTGTTDLAIYRNGDWKIQNQPQLAIHVSTASPQDIPRPGDYDGDGKVDAAIWFPGNGLWMWRSSASGGSHFQTIIGHAGDMPVIVDMDGDGMTDPATFRPSNGTWYWQTLYDSEYHSAVFGTRGDVPVTGDFDGDRKSDLAVFRPSTSFWMRKLSSNGQSIFEKFGTTGDIPVAGDYDGDGKTDLAVYRPSNGVWYMLRSSDGLTAAQFGTATDKPIPFVYSPCFLTGCRTAYSF